MGRSSLLGTDTAASEAPGRDTAALGPGDNSDSGSDMAGIADDDGSDPGVAVDIAMRDDMPHSLQSADSLSSSSTDAAGTGERRSAGSDAGGRDGADIGVDRVFIPRELRGDGDETLSEEEDADLAFVDEAEATDPMDEEGGEDDEEVEAARDEEDGSAPLRRRAAR